MSDEKETITVNWTVVIYRRHLAEEVSRLIAELVKKPDMGPVFHELVSSAKGGICVKKCICCDTNIFGDQAMGGVVHIESTAPIDDAGNYVNMMGPICLTCAEGDRDLLESRAIKTFTTVLGASNLQVVST